MIRGVNHITFSVRDLEVSFRFYTKVLGLRPVARWYKGAYLEAGVDARLLVFDALPHAFWYDPMLPEAIEANHLMADFFVKELNK